MFDYKDLVNQKVYSEGQRRRQYLIDKMMVFYSKKNQIAILPKDNLIANYSIVEDNQMMPYEVLIGVDNNKVYSEQLEYRLGKPFSVLKFPKIYYLNVLSSRFSYLENNTEPYMCFVDKASYFYLPIFPYIKEIYKIKVTDFITFRSEKEAIALFIENGGKLTEEELVELKFSKIME